MTPNPTTDTPTPYEVDYHGPNNPQWVVRLHHEAYCSYHYTWDNAQQVCDMLNERLKFLANADAAERESSALAARCKELEKALNWAMARNPQPILIPGQNDAYHAQWHSARALLQRGTDRGAT